MLSPVGCSRSMAKHDRLSSDRAGLLLGFMSQFVCFMVRLMASTGFRLVSPVWVTRLFCEARTVKTEPDGLEADPLCLSLLPKEVTEAAEEAAQGGDGALGVFGNSSLRSAEPS